MQQTEAVRLVKQVLRSSSLAKIIRLRLIRVDVQSRNVIGLLLHRLKMIPQAHRHHCLLSSDLGGPGSGVVLDTWSTKDS